MSVVTNIILTAGAGDGEEALVFINGRMGWTDRMALVDVTDERLDHARGVGIAGDKWPEVTICVGAYNYLDHAKFVAAVREAPWEFRDEVRLFVKKQGAEGFSLVALDAPEAE